MLQVTLDPEQEQRVVEIIAKHTLKDRIAKLRESKESCEEKLFRTENELVDLRNENKGLAKEIIELVKEVNQLKENYINKTAELNQKYLHIIEQLNKRPERRKPTTNKKRTTKKRKSK